MELLQHLNGKESRYIGNQLVVAGMRDQDALLLTAFSCNQMALLAPAQLKIVELVAEGCGNKEVAARLGVKEKTVRNQLTAIYKRLDLDHPSKPGAAADDVQRVSHRRAALILWWMWQSGNRSR